jgi:hypothetical protein
MGARPTATVVVDTAGNNGICSNCNRPATLDTAHSCGAKIGQVAINTEYAPDPRLSQTRRVVDLTPAGVEFVGVGRVVAGDSGWRFELTKSPGDLA